MMILLGEFVEQSPHSMYCITECNCILSRCAVLSSKLLRNFILELYTTWTLNRERCCIDIQIRSTFWGNIFLLIGCSSVTSSTYTISSRILRASCKALQRSQRWSEAVWATLFRMGTRVSCVEGTSISGRGKRWEEGKGAGLNWPKRQIIPQQFDMPPTKSEARRVMLKAQHLNSADTQ